MRWWVSRHNSSKPAPWITWRFGEVSAHYPRDQGREKGRPSRNPGEVPGSDQLGSENSLCQVFPANPTKFVGNFWSD